MAQEEAVTFSGLVGDGLGHYWLITHVLSFVAIQMVNKIFSSHTNFSQQRGNWLIQNRVISVENTNYKWQEAAGR
jgi:hypothetical protein